MTRRIFALLCIGMLAPFAGCTAASKDETSSDAKATRATTHVMSFNIRYGTAKDGENHWDKRHDAVVDAIRAYNPDLLGMQEVLAFQTDFLKEKLPEYNFLGGGRDDGQSKGEASPIAYRKDRYDLQASGMIWLSPTPETVGSKGWDAALPRVATWAILKDKHDAGREVFYVNTHWDHMGNVARVESANVMRKLIDDKRGDRPVIVTGDFNSFETQPQYATLTGQDGPGRARLLDAYRETHPTVAPDEASFNDFKGITKGLRIDWVLHSPDFTAKAANIDRTKLPDGRTPSDHYPVTAELVRTK